MIDILKVYRGDDIKINDDIIIHNPTLNEIVDFGERRYYSMVFNLCSVGNDLKWQLDDIGIDYATINDYDLFTQYISKNLKKADTKILFGDVLDFSQMELYENKNIHQNILKQNITTKKTIVNETSGFFRKIVSKLFPKLRKYENIDTYETKQIVIDKAIYFQIVENVRKMHNLERNSEEPQTEFTRLFLIDEARDNYNLNKDKPFESQLLPLISAMVNIDGFNRDDKTIFDMNIFAFMDSVKRVSKIKNATLLLQSGYSGFGINLKDIKKEEINWMS